MAGTDGTIADTDFTGTGDGLELLSAYAGVSVVWVAERMSTAIKDKIDLLAASSTDRVFLVGPDSEATALATAITDVALQRNDRIWYLHGHHYTRDPDTGEEVLVRPEGLAACPRPRWTPTSGTSTIASMPPA